MSGNRHIEVTPTNKTSADTISYKNGNPIIQFRIGSADMMLLGKSIRFCGEFSVYSDDAKTRGATTQRMSQKLGVFSTIDQLIIRNERGQTLEHIRNYNRFMATYLAATSSREDQNTHLNQSALTLPNFKAAQRGVVEFPVTDAGKSKQTFSVHLPCGLFLGDNPIPIAQSQLGGIIVEIVLAPDSNVFFASADDSTDFSTGFYEFSNVKLLAEGMRIPRDQLASMPATQVFEYNTISSYYSTINSANGIITLNLGEKRVLGAFANVISASQINNLISDGMSTMYPLNNDGSSADVKRLFFTKGGEKFPLNFDIDTRQSACGTQQMVDAQIMREGLAAIHNFVDPSRTNAAVANSQLVAQTSLDLSDKTTPLTGNFFVLGVRYDGVSDQGVDFSTQQWGLQTELDLTTDNPQAVYVFIHAKQTLVFSQQGVQVM